jgi:hypothetical protein
MQNFGLTICAGAIGMLASVAVVGATEGRVQLAQAPAAQPAPPATAPAAPSPTTPGVEPAPVAPIPGQLSLNADDQQKIRQSVEAATPPVQPVPRAFAPAVGMTSPPELKLEPVPEPARGIGGVGENHRYAMLDNGMLMLVGDNQLVVALIGPNGGTTGSSPGR